MKKKIPFHIDIFTKTLNKYINKEIISETNVKWKNFFEIPTREKHNNITLQVIELYNQLCTRCFSYNYHFTEKIGSQ